MVRRLNKNDIIRGRIFDTIAGVYGSSVLGFYEGKLRIEIIDEETGEVIQFSIAPTVHKTLVDDSECDAYVDTDTRITEYQASLKKNEEKKPKKKKEPKTKAAPKKESSAPAVITPLEFNFDEPAPAPKIVSADEQSKLDALMAELGI